MTVRANIFRSPGIAGIEHQQHDRHAGAVQRDDPETGCSGDLGRRGTPCQMSTAGQRSEPVTLVSIEQVGETEETRQAQST